MTLVYPDFDTLKRLYPTVGYRLLKPAFQTDDCVRGTMLISNQVHSEYRFRGEDEQSLYHAILRAQHFIEQRNPKSLGLRAPSAAVTSPVAAGNEQGAGGKVWVISDELVERYRVPLDQLQAYLDRGFVAGRRNFASWVDRAKIAAWTERCKQKQIESLKALVKPATLPGVDLRKGARMLFNKTTLERKRFPAHEIEAKLVEGWQISTLTQDKLKAVNVGAGRGAHFKNKRWVININSRKKQYLPREQAEQLIATGKFAPAGARTR